MRSEIQRRRTLALGFLTALAALFGCELPQAAPARGDAPAARRAPAAAAEYLPQRTEVTVSAELTALEERILEATNRERRRAGLGSVELEPTLRAIAREHSADMIERRYFAHRSPDGREPAERIAYGHRRLIGVSGENIWSGSGYSVATPDRLTEVADLIMKSWMNSPGHRENILRPEYTHLGVGAVQRGREIRVTQNFAAVRAYLDRPVPLQIAADEAPALAASSPAGDGGAPEMYDLWLPDDQRSVSGPHPLAEWHAPPRQGTYQLRFYFPQGERRYAIYPGPLFKATGSGR